ncbi:hypothetical protein ABBQ32_004260 [Trebouxia sp. C0010 RCD-2024]
MTPLWVTMFITSTLPVIQIVIMCSIGALLARKGILHGEARQHLGQLVFYVFVPCLTFTKLASSVDLKNLAVWWPLPVNTALSITAGLLIGWLTAMVIKPPKELKMHVIVATGLGNVGNLPLVIVATFCDEPASLFARELGPRCEQIGIAYVAFSMWVAGFVQYSVAYNLMKLPDMSVAPANSPPHASRNSSRSLKPRGSHRTLGEVSGTLEARAQALASAGIGEFADSKSLKSSRSRSMEEEGGLSTDELEMQPLWQQNGLSSADLASQAELGLQRQAVGHSTSHASRHSSQQLNGISPFLREAAQPWISEGDESEQQLPSRWQTAKQWVVSFWQSFLTIINAPTASALAGLAVGCTAPVKDLLFGPDPPLGFFSESLSIMAGAMIPSMMLVLGSVLHKGPGSAKVPKRVILGILAVRQIIIPMLGTGMVVLAHKWHIFRAPDPLFFMVLLLTHTTPTAINLQTVVTIHQNKEQEMSCILFWQYICSVFTLPGFMSAYLYIVNQTDF